MIPIRVVAIATKVADLVRREMKAPGYGHPAHLEVATGYGPCRHCLRPFRIGAEQRILFTLDPFHGIESLPMPGPVFIHAEPCERYQEDAGFPGTGEHIWPRWLPSRKAAAKSLKSTSRPGPSSL